MSKLDDLFYSLEDLSTSVRTGAEFVAIPTKAVEDRPNPGMFYSYQDQFARAAHTTPYAVCIYKPGTGKTQTYVDACESFRLKTTSGNQYVNQYMNTGKIYIKRSIILTSNTALVSTIKDHLIAYYRARGYDLNDIDKFYTITTHQRFSNSIRDDFFANFLKHEIYEKPSAKTKNLETKRTYTYKEFMAAYKKFCSSMAAKFSGTVFIFDESMEIAGEEPKFIDMDFLRKGENYDGDGDIEKIEEIFSHIFNILHLISHLGKNIMRYAFSGTIMKNGIKEFSTSFNIALPRDKQIDYYQDFSLWGDEEFKVFDNITFYIEHSKGDTNIVYHGDYHSTSEYSFFSCPIKKDSIQEDAYLHTTIQNSIMGGERQYAGNMVDMNGDVLTKEMATNPKFTKFLQNDENLRQVSSKGFAIKKIIESFPNSKIGIQEEFITDSGTNVDVAVLLSMGYVEYIPGEDEKLTVDLQGNVKGTVAKRFIQYKRIANVLKQVMNIWKSKGNVTGKYLKVFLGSPSSSVGLSIEETTVIIVGSEKWNFAADQQIVYRFIRDSGFIQTIEKQKRDYAEAVKRGEKPDWNPNVVNINVYLLVSTFGRKDWTPFEKNNWKGIANPPIISGKIQTVGEHRIRRAEEKQVGIDVFMIQMIKRSATLYLNQERNTDIGITSSYSPNPDNLNYSVFDNLYLNDYISFITSYICNYMQTHSVVKVVDIISSNSFLNYPLEVYEEVIELLVSSKTVIKNRYGISNYIRYADGVLYLDSDYPVGKSSIVDSYYSGKIPLLELIEEADIYPDFNVLIAKILKGKTVEDVRERLMTVTTRKNGKGVKLPVPIFMLHALEYAMKKYYIENNDDYLLIIQVFKLYIYIYEGDKETIYFHTFHANKLQESNSYTLMSYFFNPKFIRAYRNNIWTQLPEKIALYDQMRSIVCEELPKRIKKQIPDMRTPLIADPMYDGRGRIVRSKQGVDDRIQVCGGCEEDCGSSKKADRKLIPRGVIFADVRELDFCDAFYSLSPESRSPNWKTLSDIALERLDRMISDTYGVETYEEFFETHEIPLKPRNISSSLSILLKFKLNSPSDIPAESKYPSLELLVGSEAAWPEKKFVSKVKEEFLRPGYEYSINWFGKLIANASLYTKTRGVYVKPLIIDKSADQGEYLEYMYNWVKYYSTWERNTIASEFIKVAKQKKRYLYI